MYLRFTYEAKFCFIFGTGLILDPVLKILPKNKINLHLGLSPWYKGAATLFWPFYFLQPNYAGATFHEINNKIDEGPILHQSIPKLLNGQGIHDVANNVIKVSKKDLKKIIEKIIQNKKLKFTRQKKEGKIFYTNTFKPHHLKVIYDLFDNKIVDYFLKNTTQKKLNIIKFV